MAIFYQLSVQVRCVRRDFTRAPSDKLDDAHYPQEPERQEEQSIQQYQGFAPRQECKTSDSESSQSKCFRTLEQDRIQTTGNRWSEKKVCSDDERSCPLSDESSTRVQQEHVESEAAHSANRKCENTCRAYRRCLRRVSVPAVHLPRQYYARDQLLITGVCTHDRSLVAAPRAKNSRTGRVFSQYKKKTPRIPQAPPLIRSRVAS